MDFQRGICRTLHNEHVATIEAMDGLEDLLARGRRGLPDLDQPETRGVLEGLSTLVGEEMHRHFSLEEEELFTRLAEAGEVGIGKHLTEEHRAILPVADRLAALAREALANGMSEQAWEEFRGLAAGLIERMLAHIQKEEMALLPLLEETLAADEDLELVARYSDKS